MIPPDVLVNNGFLAISEIFKFLQTPEGQAALKQAREDRAQLDAFWKPIYDGIKDFITQLQPKAAA